MMLELIILGVRNTKGSGGSTHLDRDAKHVSSFYILVEMDVSVTRVFKKILINQNYIFVKYVVNNKTIRTKR